MGRVEGKVDGILSHLEKMNGRLEKGEDRLDRLDNQMTEVKTKAAILGAAFGAAVTIAWQFLKDKIRI